MRATSIARRADGLDIVPLVGRDGAFVFRADPPTAVLLASFSLLVLLSCDGRDLGSSISVLRNRIVAPSNQQVERSFWLAMGQLVSEGLVEIVEPSDVA